MASLDFPANPVDQQQYTLNGIVYYYNASVGAWLTVLTSKLSDTSSNTQVMFNDAGVSNGSYGLTYNKIANTLISNNVYVTNTFALGTNDPSYGGNVGSVFTINGNNKTGLAIAANSSQLSFAINPQTNGSWFMYDRAGNGGTVWTVGLTQANGNVGIGKAVAASKLDVDGAINTSSTVTLAAVPNFRNIPVVASNYTISTTYNEMSIGPITVADGVTVNIAGEWVIV